MCHADRAGELAEGACAHSTYCDNYRRSAQYLYNVYNTGIYVVLIWDTHISSTYLTYIHMYILGTHMLTKLVDYSQ